MNLNVSELKSHINLVGLSFWQAWWMLAMSSGAFSSQAIAQAMGVAPSEVIMGITAMGYLAAVLLLRRKAPLLDRHRIWAVVAVCASVGTLGMAACATPTGSIDAFTLTLFVVATTLFAFGNATLLMMWGELWSQISTGRVAIGLVASYTLAFVLYFALLTLPKPAIGIAMACLPLASLVALRYARNDPRRTPAQVAYENEHVSFAKLIVPIAILSAVWGITEALFVMMPESADGGMALSFAYAGVLMAIILAAFLLLKPPVEPDALYRIVTPTMVIGLIVMAANPTALAVVGNSLVTVGIYALDMLIMLVATDLAFRLRKSVIDLFGVGIFVTRIFSFLGVAGLNALWPAVSNAMSPQQMLLACAVASLCAGSLIFTQSDLTKLYKVKHVNVVPQSLSARCDQIAQMCSLTPREREVLELLAHGRNVPYIANELSIATGTVKHHVSNIYRKVGVYDRQSLHDVIEQGAPREG